jgi:hypothetical protein
LIPRHCIDTAGKGYGNEVGKRSYFLYNGERGAHRRGELAEPFVSSIFIRDCVVRPQYHVAGAASAAGTAGFVYGDIDCP